jgi:glyoxylase-like metal-dependent hydrolase (beta-lactamase superfamily II)
VSIIPTIHTHASGEGGIFANAYLVETTNGVVAVDALLTRSESRALRAEIDALGKPLLAALITHAHPDHVAGLTELVSTDDVPILAVQAVVDEMRATEAAKHTQWQPMFGDEWIPRWTYPNRIVGDGEVVHYDGVRYRVHDLGPGGDCPANSIWTIEADGETPAAFIGDLAFNGTHVYLADGDVLAWLANLERVRPPLADVMVLYPGHGPSGTLSLLDAQRDYLLAYCAAVSEIANGSSTLSEEGKTMLAARMDRVRPGAALGFMIGLSADAVATELAVDRQKSHRQAS